MAYQVLEKIQLDNVNRRYRVWIAGLSELGLIDCHQRYIDVGTPYSWNSPTTEFELAIDNYGAGPHYTWCNLNPSEIGWFSPSICDWEVMNPSFQDIDLGGLCTTVRAYFCGTYYDQDNDSWGQSAGDVYSDYTSAGGIRELNFNLWQRVGTGGPENKDYYWLWINGDSVPYYWYGDFRICGWECASSLPPFPPGPGPTCPLR